jgi:Na+-translocating ferredoxin:NAD+ oxidoreductase RnfG subunit
MKNEKKTALWESLLIGAKLLLICAIVAGTVSLVFQLTKDQYAKNLQKTKDEAVAAIFETEGLTSKEISSDADAVVYEVYDANGGFFGYCVEAAGKGFGSKSSWFC